MSEDFSIYNGEGTLLRQAQHRMLNILLEVDKICRKNNLSYWIDYGTLLGAVRHKGYIPWDDDIDISMPSDDYKKFTEIANNELPEGFFLQTSETDPAYKRSVCKVRDTNSFIAGYNDDFCAEYNKGLYIDIFEKREYPSIPPSLFRKMSKWINKTSIFFEIKQYPSLKTAFATIIFPIINLFCRFVIGLFNIKSKTKLGLRYGQIDLYPVLNDKKDILPTIDIEFEGHLLKAPANPDVILKSYYGDYMQLPPEEKRKVHGKHIYLNKP